MKKALTFSFSAVLLAAALFAGEAGAQAIPQDSLIQQKLLTPYAQYFEFPAEGIYTHFNKNAYMTGEGVWFKIYLMDIGEKRPFDLAQNVYAELFDPAGKAVDKQVLFAEKGSASGMFRLADTLAPGTYTFRAYTNWMRNMDDHVFYTRTFEISGGVPRPAGDAQAAGGPAGDTGGASGQTVSRGDYDIQFFPEGGTLLEGIPNAVAFKIVNPQGKGESLKGILRNGGGDTLLQLAAGPLGMSNLQLTPKPGERYTADFVLPGGKVQSVELPAAQPQGISVSAQWFFPDKVSVLLRTNPQSLAGLNGKQFYLLVHNRGQVAQMMIVKWTTRPLLKIDMDKSLLLNGINHVTLFDEHFQPVASRMVFNQKKEALGQLDVQTQLEGDSLAISLTAQDQGGQPLEADMSISFLPGETRRGTFGTSIYTALLLESDLQGPVENAAWYFEKEDFERLRGLDYLLLTQGWRAYDWEKVAKGSRPEPVHEFEQGFTITGEVVNSISRNEMGNSQVSLFSPGNGIMTLLEVDSSGTFTLPKAFLVDSSRVIINATNAKGRSGFRELKATVTPPRYEKAAPALPPPAPAAPEHNTSLVLPAGSELLEAVTVTGRAKTPEEKAFAGDTYYSPISDRVVVITKENYFKYNSLRDMLMKEFNFVGNSLGRGGGPPVLIVDGMPMDDLTWLDGIHISEVEAVAVNKSGNAMLGQRGANGSINIKTRTQAVDWGPRRDLNIVRLLVDGFSAPVAYYSPKYEVPASEPDFRERAAVYWKPDVASDSFGRATFKFALPSGLDSLHVRTEGISSAGVLMIDEQVIGIK